MGLNTIRLGASVYFFAKEIVNYFKVKKCSEMLSGAVPKAY